jgi:hypothetical protein
MTDPHHPECELISAQQLAAERGKSLPAWANPDVPLRRCHSDCPHRRRTEAIADELARRYGW